MSESSGPTAPHPAGPPPSWQASWRALGWVVAAASAAYTLSVPLGPALPVPPLAGALLAFLITGAAICGVAAVCPTAKPRQLALLLLPLGLLAAVLQLRASLPPSVAAGLINAALLTFGGILGSAVGGRVEHAGHLVLLAWVASVVDVLSVFVPEGPTAQIIASPEVALPLVTLSWPIFGTGSVEPLIGVGDVTIASVYGAAARATGLRRARLLAGLFAGFVLTFAALVAFERALPALPMLSLGVVVALAPASLRVPAADRKKGFAFAALLTVGVAVRLGTWLWGG